jgi:hypothetical protein
VNIGHHLQVPIEAFHGHEVELRRVRERARARPGQPPRRVAAADQHGREVQDDLIHDAVADRAPGERRPPLQQHPLDVTLAEDLHQRRQ